MVDLVETTPCQGLLPVEVGTLRLSEVAPGRMTSLAPYRGQEAALDAALARAHGLGWPAPGQVIAGDAGSVQWFGRDLAFLIGPVPDQSLAAHAALTDQSDGWAVLRMEGEGATAAMARLCPLDLRASVFADGATARTAVAHMSGAVTRTGPEAYDITGFRSMAESLVHEIALAMRRVVARG